MFEKLGKWLDENRDYGVSLWYAYDPNSQKASATLLFAYLSFMAALFAGVTTLWYPSMLMGTMTLMTFNVILIILYMINKITSAKFDLDDRSFSVSNENKEDK